MLPFFVIAGATAVGKSEIAVAVAECVGGEIVGADAFQVYGGLPILTAHPSPELQARVRHHLVGSVPLGVGYDVAQYVEEARRAIAEIGGRGKVAIVCGGAGLYVRSLMHGLAELPGADAALRAELEGLPLEELQRRFAELDAHGAAQIDMKNPRRVIRALEVCLLTGRPFSTFREQWASPLEGVRGVFLTREREALNARIDARTVAMFSAGVVEEVQAVGEVGPTAAQTLGLREIRALLAGEMDRAECIAAIQQATRRYAKRQGTWFRRETALEAMALPMESPVEAIVARMG